MKLFLFITLAILPCTALAAETLSGNDDNSKKPISVDADKLEVFQADNKAVFSGNVIAKQGTMTVKSDKMTIYKADTPATPAPQKKAVANNNAKNGIKKIDLEGNVFLTAPDQTAKSQEGYYDMEKNFISMSGDVILTKDNNILKGNKLDYSVETGYSKLYSEPGQAGKTGGRVSGLFIPTNADGQSKK